MTQKSKPKKGKLRRAFAAAVLSLVALTGIGGCGALVHDHNQEETVTATVNDKAVKGSDGQYLIFTTEGVLQNSDSILKWKWDSSDVYNNIHVGCTYEFNTHGWRNHGLSLYPNILEARHVPTDACPTNTAPTPGR